MRRVAVAVVVAGGLALSACSATGSTIPNVYLAAQGAVHQGDKYLAAADTAETHDQLNKIVPDYRLELRACKAVAKHTNGPNAQMNKLLKRYSTDCAEQAAGDVAFWKNPLNPPPTAADQRSLLDAVALNALWKKLGY